MAIGKVLGKEVSEKLVKAGPIGRLFAKKLGGKTGKELSEKAAKEAAERSTKRQAAKKLAQQSLKEGNTTALRAYSKIILNSKAIYYPLSIVAGIGGVFFIIGEYAVPKISNWVERQLENLNLSPTEAKAISGYVLLLGGIGIVGLTYCIIEIKDGEAKADEA